MKSLLLYGLRRGFIEVGTFDLSAERWVGAHVIGQRKKERSREVVCKKMQCSGNV